MKDDGKLMIIIMVIAALIIFGGGLFGRQGVFDEGVVCDIPSGGGSCEYELTIPAGSKAGDGYLELGFESIVSDWVTVPVVTEGVGPRVTTFGGVGNDCGNNIPCDYIDNQDDNVHWYWEILPNTLSGLDLVNYSVSGTVNGDYRLDSRSTFSGENGDSEVYVFVKDVEELSSATSDIIANPVNKVIYHARTRGENNRYGEYGCDYYVLNTATNVLEHTYDSYDVCGSWTDSCARTAFNNCYRDSSLQKTFSTQGTGNPSMVLLSVVNDGSNAAVLTSLSFTINNFQYTYNERVLNYDMSIGIVTLANDVEVIGGLSDSPQIPGTINTYCDRVNYNGECVVPITFSSDEGGKIYILPQLIIVPNDLYVAPINNTPINNTDNQFLWTGYVFNYATELCEQKQIMAITNPYAYETMTECMSGHSTTITIECGEYYQPVCGYDGITYNNNCYAEKAGMTIKSTGACTKPPIDNSINPLLIMGAGLLGVLVMLRFISRKKKR